VSPLRKRGKRKGGSRQDYEIGCGGYLLVRLIRGLEYGDGVLHTCNAKWECHVI
jgi:hypothetical protein